MNLWTAWKQQTQTPFPTLDHHLFHVFLPFAALFIAIDAGTGWGATLIVWGVFIVFELVQMVFFNETERNSFNDMTQFSFVWVLYFSHFGNYWLAGLVGVALLTLYYLLTTRRI